MIDISWKFYEDPENWRKRWRRREKGYGLDAHYYLRERKEWKHTTILKCDRFKLIEKEVLGQSKWSWLQSIPNPANFHLTVFSFYSFHSPFRSLTNDDITIWTWHCEVFAWCSDYRTVTQETKMIKYFLKCARFIVLTAFNAIQDFLCVFCGFNSSTNHRNDRCQETIEIDAIQQKIYNTKKKKKKQTNDNANIERSKKLMTK